MQNLDQFMNENSLLSSSIVFASLDIGIHINKTLEKKLGISILNTNLPKNEWRYYKNISGEYSEYDTDMMIFVAELNKEVKLTKSLLDTYPYLRTELLKFDKLYKEIENVNKEQVSLLRGIMLPVDIDVAINAQEGQILNYNTSLIEEQERDLIPYVQSFIDGVFSRWHNNLFTIIEDNYLPAFIANIYSKLPAVLFNYRLSKVKTPFAHSFHINEYFKSNRSLDIETKVLNKEVKTWLYKNLDYLLTNTGRVSNLDMIIKNILTPSGIGIGQIRLLEHDIEKNESDYADLNKLPYSKNRDIFVSEALNKSFIVNNNRKRDISLLLREDLDSNKQNDILGDTYNFVYTNIKNIIANNKYSESKTKLLEIDKVNRYSLQTIPDIIIILDNWFANVDKYTETHTFKDPNTAKEYNINSRQAMLFILKLLASKAGLTNPVLDKYTCHSSLDNVVTIEQLSKGSYDQSSLSKLLTDIYSTRPSFKNEFNKDTMNEYLLDINKLSTKMWSAMSNIDNAIIINGLERAFDRTLIEKDIDLKVDGVSLTVDELITREGLDFQIGSSYDYVISLNTIIKIFTGINIDKAQLLEDTITHHMNLVKKLSSYTIHFIHEKTSSSRLEVGYKTNTTISAIEPIFNINDKLYTGLEPMYRHVLTHTTDEVIVPHNRFLKCVTGKMISPLKEVPIVATILKSDYTPIVVKKFKPYVMLAIADRDIALFRLRIELDTLDEIIPRITSSAKPLVKFTRTEFRPGTTLTARINDLIFEPKIKLKNMIKLEMKSSVDNLPTIAYITDVANPYIGSPIRPIVMMSSSDVTLNASKPTISLEGVNIPVPIIRSRNTTEIIFIDKDTSENKNVLDGNKTNT